MRHLLAAAVATFRIGLLSTMAYRASLLIWVLTTTFPLVSLALWAHLAESGAVGGFSRGDFVAYFTAAFIVRQLASSWVVWDLDQQIRSGDLSTLLLRPMPGVVHLAMMNVAALPVRLLLALPLALAILAWAADEGVTRTTVPLLAIAIFAIAGAWLVNFLGQLCVGCLAFWIVSASSLYEIWLGLYIVLSGYSVPTELFPWGLAEWARWLPFHACLGFPVELVVGRLDGPAIAQGFAVQAAWIALFSGLATVLWGRGLRRYHAVGA